MVTREEEIAWAAGLFEGEGTFTWDYGRAQLRVKMTDLDVLEKLLDIWSVGKVYGPYETNSKEAPCENPMGLDLSAVLRARSFRSYGPLARGAPPRPGSPLLRFAVKSHGQKGQAGEVT
jgi:hypothetical protein